MNSCNSCQTPQDHHSSSGNDTNNNDNASSSVVSQTSYGDEDEKIIKKFSIKGDFLYTKDGAKKLIDLTDMPRDESNYLLERSTQLPPCGKEWCIMGCICINDKRKRRSRSGCKNISCIFECVCRSLYISRGSLRSSSERRTPKRYY